MKASFILSLDLELAWGSIDKPEMFRRNEKYYLETRNIVVNLLQLFEKYQFGCTWAIVGHLFLDRCEERNGIKHPEIVRSILENGKPDWFSVDPCTSIKRDPLWYGKDIVENILKCSVDQEIGSHSFAHILYGDTHTTQEAVDTDLKESVRLASESGLQLNSFIFPRNSEGFYHELKNHGFICYRGDTKTWYRKFQGKTKKILHICDQALGLKPNIIYPEYKESLINIPGSMLYLSRDGFRKFIPIASRVRKAKKGIDQAIRSKSIFHLWFHPFNIASDSDNLLKGLEDILLYLKTREKKGEIEVLTMGEIAKREIESNYFHSKKGF
jgi:peptidoglycan/xylan/chitin deacetylase (PgdA/CDA1 family)